MKIITRSKFFFQIAYGSENICFAHGVEKIIGRTQTLIHSFATEIFKCTNYNKQL